MLSSPRCSKGKGENRKPWAISCCIRLFVLFVSVFWGVGEGGVIFRLLLYLTLNIFLAPRSDPASIFTASPVLASYASSVAVASVVVSTVTVSVLNSPPPPPSSSTPSPPVSSAGSDPGGRSAGGGVGTIAIAAGAGGGGGLLLLVVVIIFVMRRRRTAIMIAAESRADVQDGPSAPPPGKLSTLEATVIEVLTKCEGGVSGAKTDADAAGDIIVTVQALVRRLAWADGSGRTTAPLSESDNHSGLAPHAVAATTPSQRKKRGTRAARKPADADFVDGC